MQKPKVTCVKCGAQSTFWLCSNACVLAYAKQRGATRCAICSYDKKTGRIGRHDTTKICAECRSHAENAGWTHKKQEEADELIETRVDELDRLREQQDTPLLVVTPEVTAVAKLVVEGERVAYQYRDPNGRSFGVRYRWRGYTVRRLAKNVGSSRAFVERVIRSIEK